MIPCFTMLFSQSRRQLLHHARSFSPALFLFLVSPSSSSLCFSLSPSPSCLLIYPRLSVSLRVSSISRFFCCRFLWDLLSSVFGPCTRIFRSYVVSFSFLALRFVSFRVSSSPPLPFFLFPSLLLLSWNTHVFIIAIYTLSPLLSFPLSDCLSSLPCRHLR